MKRLCIDTGGTFTDCLVLTKLGAKTGMITTKNFRDIIEIRRGVEERTTTVVIPPGFVCQVDSHKNYLLHAATA
ncbi:MAG: hypothetical protein HYY46_22110 [Deltaproteobacteria bacterium]|nr:hypothetical protein [Deltaproteobacteria bacterium]